MTERVIYGPNAQGCRDGTKVCPGGQQHTCSTDTRPCSSTEIVAWLHFMLESSPSAAAPRQQSSTCHGMLGRIMSDGAFKIQD